MNVPSPTRYHNQNFYRRCGRSGLNLPLISLGQRQNFGGTDSFENGRVIMRRAFDLGNSHYNLTNNYGPPYGSAEETFDRLLQLDLTPYRGELVVSTKAGYDIWPGPYGNCGSRKYLLASLDQSLRRVERFLKPYHIAEDKIIRIRSLDAIARQRGDSLTQMALAWVLRQPAVTTALIGASKPGQIDENVAAVKNLGFSADELVEIAKVLAN
jgi:aryl-alcohol dehydrogenase-like predicted oxidoreductase